MFGAGSKRKEPEPDSAYGGDFAAGGDDATNVDELVADLPDVEVLDESNLKRHVLAFEKKLLKNQQMRIKYADEPEKFVDSEVDLNEGIVMLHSLATNAELYEEFARLGATSSLVTLLSHENIDIVLGVVDLLSEITDPEVVLESDNAIKLIEALQKDDVGSHLVQVLLKLNFDSSDDEKGIHDILDIFDNFAELKIEICEDAFSSPALFEWVLKIVQRRDISQNRSDLVDLLSVIIQASPKIRQTFSTPPPTDTFLSVFARYKKRAVRGEGEAEFVFALSDIICCLLLGGEEGRDSFLKGEGVELMLLVVRERQQFAPLALKILSFAVLESPPLCDRLVEATGLKTIFPCFTHTSHISKSKSHDKDVNADEEHVISILFALLQHLRGEGRARVLLKFVEEEEGKMKKLDRLFALLVKYSKKIEICDKKWNESSVQLEEGEDPVERRHLMRMEHGLLVLYHLSFILSSLIAIENVENNNSDFADLPKIIQHKMKKNSIRVAFVAQMLEEFGESLADSLRGDAGGEGEGEGEADGAENNNNTNNNNNNNNTAAGLELTARIDHLVRKLNVIMEQEELEDDKE